MKVISLFCGCWWLDLWFHQAGHEIVYSNDFDKDAIDTYKKNIETENSIVEHKSITDVSVNDIPNADVIIGWFPCQGFSIANQYRKEEDDRNKLYLELLRIIKWKKTKFFLAENVTGICSLGWYDSLSDKKNKLGRVFKMILRDFESIGYRVSRKILDSSEYGVPQVRKRVIIVWVRNDVDVEYVFPKANTIKKLTVRDSIGDLPIEYSHTIPNHQWSKYKVKVNGYIWNRHTQWDKPSPTITWRWWWTGGPIIMPHPSQKRRMTVREYARLQSFPDDFIFYGSVSSQYRQIWNAVPPLLWKALWEQFFDLHSQKKTFYTTQELLFNNVVTA